MRWVLVRDRSEPCGDTDHLKPDGGQTDHQSDSGGYIQLFHFQFPNVLARYCFPVTDNSLLVDLGDDELHDIIIMGRDFHFIAVFDDI